MEKGQGHETSSKSKTQAAKGAGAPRGFAAMDEKKQREIARKGGESVPPEKRSFSRNHELAAEAGREGGKHSHGGGRSKVSAQGEGESEVVQTPTKGGRSDTGQFHRGSEASAEAGKKGGRH